MNPKDFIEQAKDYADIADASYAMLHYIDNNEEIDTFLDTMKANNPNPKVRPPARWIYADGIQLGYEVETLTEMSKNNDRQLGQPTAYALAIEARFSKNMTINMPKYDNLSKALFYSMNFMRIFLVSFIVALVLCVPFAGIMNIINLASHNALFSTLGFGKEFSYVLIPFLLVQPVYCLVSKHCTFIHYVLFLPYNATPILIFCGLMYATK